MSKGSKPRPLSVSKEEFEANWDAIFGSDSQKENENSGSNPDTSIQDIKDERYSIRSSK